MKYLFLMNPLGDKRQVRTAYSSISLLRREMGEESVISVETEYAGHAEKIIREYSLAYGPDVLVIACGGDGTAHEAANALAFSETPLCVFPLGTGNDFVRSVLPEPVRKDPIRLVSSLPSLSVRPVDLFSVECFDSAGDRIPDSKRYCLNITSFGLDTAVQSVAKKIVNRFRRFPPIRKNAYTAATVYSIVKGWNYAMSYSFIDGLTGEKIEGELPFILSAFCNGAYYGNGFNPAPDASLTDGLMDVCLVEDLSLAKVIPLVQKYKKGTHLSHEKIHHFRIKSAIVRAAGQVPLLRGNYDGEDFSGYEIRMEMSPQSLRYGFLRDTGHMGSVQEID